MRQILESIRGHIAAHKYRAAIVASAVVIAVSSLLHVPIYLTLMVLAILSVGVACIFALPGRIVRWDIGSQVSSLSHPELLKARNDVRTTLLQAVGGTFFIVTALFTWQQLQVAKSGQITDRFTDAVGQLGSKNTDIRLGGVHALIRIAEDSSSDRSTIVYVLTAYVERHSPWKGTPQEKGSKAAAKGTCPPRTEEGPLKSMSAMEIRKADVQAALHFLIDQPGPDRNASSVYLLEADLRVSGLSGGYLKGGDLRGGNFEWADFSEANMENVDASSGGLYCGAHFEWAILDGAIMKAANLEDAHFDEAELLGVDFTDADLDRATFKGATADQDTKWPDGFDWRKAGVRCQDSCPTPQRG